MEKCNGTGLVLKICETKNNVWKMCEISIQDSIDNYIETTKIKPNFASLNRLQAVQSQPVMRMERSGIRMGSAGKTGKHCRMGLLVLDVSRM